MQNLTVTLIQKDLAWENPSQNLADFEQIIKTVPSASGLIILPEMFTTGFSMNPHKWAEKMTGTSVKWLQKMARQTKNTITGSLIIQDHEQYFNRLIWVTPDGALQTYDKRHLFSYAKENLHYAPGQKIIEPILNNWKIRPLICYDLRFPVWSWNTTDYDLLVYVANWPERRIQHWRSLLIARAIENQSFVIGLNRVGNDGQGIYHNGNSLVISPQGQVLLEVIDCECTETITLQKQTLLQYRKDFPALDDRD